MNDVVASPPTVDVDATAKPVVSGAHHRFRTTKTFDALDGLRALCCLGVIKEHVNWHTQVEAIDHGDLGVDAFFVISGFLIVTLMLRERERRGRINLRNFYMRRTLRIFPIYYLMIFGAMAFAVAVSPWKPRTLEMYRWTFPVLLTYTQDFIVVPLGSFFHCWSLAMEEQFYLVWPTIEARVPLAGRWFTLALVVGVSQMVNFGVFDDVIVRVYGDPEAPRRMPVFLATFTPIAFGVAIAYLLHSERTFRRVYAVVGHRWAFLVFALVGLGFLQFSRELGRAWPKLGAQTIIAFLIASLVIRPDHAAMPVLRFRPLARIGVISYGTYLYHTWVILGMASMGVRISSPALAFLMVTALTVALAEASYRLLEQRILRLRERFPS